MSTSSLRRDLNRYFERMVGEMTHRSFHTVQLSSVNGMVTSGPRNTVYFSRKATTVGGEMERKKQREDEEEEEVT